MGRIVYIEISSFEGMSPGAEHYYGHLRGSSFGDVVYLYRPLTESETAYLNKKDGRISYYPGEESERFDDENGVIEAAKKKFSELIIDGVLIEGSPVIASPQRIVAVSGARYAEFMRRGNELFTERDAMDINNTYDEDRTFELCEEWDELIEEFGLTDKYDEPLVSLGSEDDGGTSVEPDRKLVIPGRKRDVTNASDHVQADTTNTCPQED